jgi:hypothetical protein
MFSATGNLQLLLLGDILVDKELVIIGNGAGITSIDGSGLNRILTIDNANQVYLSGISFTNGSAADVGGAISIDSTDVTINDCVVKNSTAMGASATQGGGGIYNNAGMLTITGSMLDNNDATGTSGSGGAILNSGSGSVMVMNSTISNNTSQRAGGGIEGTSTGGKIMLTNVSLLDNATGPMPGNGGGLHVTGTDTVVVTGGTVSGNIADSEGGGLWNNGGFMSVTGTLIRNNIASGNAADNGGGGIFNNGGDMDITAIITNNMADGTSGSGGGIFSTDGDINVTLTNLDSNSANRAGGAVEIINGSFDFDGRSTMSYNDVDGSAGTPNPGNGGGVHVSGTGAVTISDVQIAYNRAGREGGGLWNQSGATMTVNNVFINDNVANGSAVDDGGGGIFNNGGNLIVNAGTVIHNNSALNGVANGGGIMTLGGTMTITSATLTSNKTVRAGGGIENTNGVVTLNSIMADSNYAGINGGGVHVSGTGTTNVNGGSFTNNVANQEGGGLWNASGVMTINGTTISGNKAMATNNAGNDQGGGGLFNIGGTMVVKNAIITNNMATMNLGNGGGVMTDGGTVTIDSSSISGNTCARAGGGIENFNGMVTINETSVGGMTAADGNTAGINGGGIHVSGTGTTDVMHSRFRNNIAQREGGGLWNNAGTMTITNCLVADNSANGAASDDGGGGIFNNGGTLVVMTTDILTNKATGAAGSGGGIFNFTGGTTTITNSTINGNDAKRAGGGIEDQAGAGFGLDIMNTNLMNNTTGSAPGNGGAIHITGAADANISASIISGNTAARDGGGLWNGSGIMTVTESTIDDNYAMGTAPGNGGGGIWNNGGTVMVSRSTVSANHADMTNANGGGIYNANGSIDVDYSTVSGNSADNNGGGIYNVGTAMVSASTIANNSATNGGGIDQGIAVTNLTTLNNTIVADNMASGMGYDVFANAGAYASNGYNLIEKDDANVFPASATDIEGMDPNLGPLADNGGGTQTHALICPSPAVNAGDMTLMANDQTGMPVFGGTRDIGSFELQTACTGGVVACNTYISDSSWMKSTVVTPSNLSGVWSGVNGMLPADATFSVAAMVGQPYGYQSINNVEGAEVIKTGRDITYFRKTIMIDSLENFEARVRLLVDDHAEVYVNGQLLVGQYTGNRNNYKLPSFDAMFNNDNTVDNPNGGGVAFDAVSNMDLDNIFKIGMNTITIAVRNYAKASDMGGFSLRIDLCGEEINGALPTMDSLVSSNAFEKSTVVTPSNFSGFWAGVSSLPATSTYTMAAVEGQPYSFPSINAVPGSKVITTESNNITYFRREFSLTSSSNLDTRIRMTVDDGMEVYINGQLIAREENVSRSNYKAPAHDVKFNANGTVMNGFMGGDMFDFTTLASMDDVFNTGMNELVVVVRNLGKASDRGGFSFRMEVESNGQSVLVADKKVAVAHTSASVASNLSMDVYPNPASGSVNVHYETAGYELMVFDMNGKMMSQQQVDAQDASLDISEYAAGVYFVKVKSGDKVITQKLIKE